MEALWLGIDPGLRTTGYGLIAMAGPRLRIVDAGTIRAEVRLTLSQRLAQIHADLSALLQEYRPLAVGVEKLYSHYRHPQTAVVMGHVRGVILLAAAEVKLTVYELAATEIKRSLTGNGRASKPQVQQAIRLRLGLSAVPRPSDIADALAIAMCIGSRLQRPSGRRRGVVA
ncbi:MAG: Crossover junction endodeoxyribonuclease RuvC [Phycisphaerae bacterium]|nr:Crossover junction endodeoxyribonuclease RuvC [Phycisphaerae bacterium]